MESRASTLWSLALGAAFLFVCLHGLARVSVLALDDTFIYFNYAKHLAAGNGFVFDPRGIPSEGVTSLLFLLMLVPWEWARANPMTGAVLYNALACVGTALLLGVVGRRAGLLNRWMAPVASLLFLLVCCYDKSIRLVTFRGLETMLGPLGVVAACACAASALRNKEKFERRVAGFMGAAFLTYLVRPEYIAYLGAVGMVLLLRPARMRLLWRPGLLLAGLFAVLFLWKWHTFGALMPTAYYRKIAGGDPDGLAYVLRWAGAYWPLLLCTAAGLTLAAPVRRNPFVLALLIAAVANVFLVTRMTILVGYGFRFLILPTTVAYLTVVLAVCAGLQRLPGPRPLPAALAAWGILALAFVVKPLPFGYPQAWNLASRADAAFRADPYFQFAQTLKPALPDPAAFTLSFGDAGTLPYALGCRYLDPNGLSEPAIAALFRQEDGPEKARTFADLIFGHAPDMVILPLGMNRDAEGRFLPGVNEHDPFRGTIPGAYWERLVADGFVYVCTLELHYPVHVTLRTSSLLYGPLRQALDGITTGRAHYGPLRVRGADFEVLVPSAP